MGNANLFAGLLYVAVLFINQIAGLDPGWVPYEIGAVTFLWIVLRDEAHGKRHKELVEALKDATDQ